MSIRSPIRTLASLITLTVVTAAHADFFDQGFQRAPVVRTDFISSYAGTSAAPLTVGPCQFNENPCKPLNTIWRQSDAWTMNWPNCLSGFDCPDYWTLTMNNENSNAEENPGPPDASLPRALPGHGIMGFTALYGNDNFPGDTYWRAHLVLNLYYPNPVYGGEPFLGFGAFAHHGNGQDIAHLNPSTGSSQFLKFDARLWYSLLPQPITGGTQPGTITSWLQVFANWGTHPKAIQIALFHQSTDSYLGTRTMAPLLWDWRWTQSAYYPGAEFSGTRAEDLSSYCGINMPSLVLGQDIHYSINLQSLFECFSRLGMFRDGSGVEDPLPSTRNIPITIVNWANEGTGVDGALWTDVHNISISTKP